MHAPFSQIFSSVWHSSISGMITNFMSCALNQNSGGKHSNLSGESRCPSAYNPRSQGWQLDSSIIRLLRRDSSCYRHVESERPDSDAQSQNKRHLPRHGSVRAKPFWNPLSHIHLYEPSVFMQVPCIPQMSRCPIPSPHSLMSEQNSDVIIHCFD